MHKFDVWVHASLLFMINEDGDSLSCIRLPSLQPVQSGTPIPVHTIQVLRTWKLPSLNPGLGGGMYVPTVRYHTTARLGSWKPQSRDPCTAALLLYGMTQGPMNEFGGMTFIITAPDANGVVQPATWPLPDREGAELRQSLERPYTQLDLHAHSRMHMLASGFFVSISTTAELHQPTGLITMGLRAYAFKDDGKLVRNPPPYLKVPLEITGARRGRIKLTGAPCAASGTFLATEKALAVTQNPHGLGHQTKYTTRIWVMRFQ